VRVNTEFYSWDTSFGLVNPRLRYSHVCKLYSASTLVLFFLSASCSWDGGSRASAQLKLNVPRMFVECSLNVPHMFPECSSHVPGMFTERSLNVP
jgi:hypothetical protein